jgi:hypothetical protein
MGYDTILGNDASFFTFRYYFLGIKLHNGLGIGNGAEQNGTGNKKNIFLIKMVLNRKGNLNSAGCMSFHKPFSLTFAPHNFLRPMLKENNK